MMYMYNAYDVHVCLSIAKHESTFGMKRTTAKGDMNRHRIWLYMYACMYIYAHMHVQLGMYVCTMYVYACTVYVYACSVVHACMHMYVCMSVF